MVAGPQGRDQRPRCYHGKGSLQDAYSPYGRALRAEDTWPCPAKAAAATDETDGRSVSEEVLDGRSWRWLVDVTRKRRLRSGSGDLSALSKRHRRGYFTH